MHKTGLVWNLILPEHHILAYLDLVQIARKACEDFKIIVQRSANSRRVLRKSLKYVWRDPPVKRKRLDSIKEDGDAAVSKREDGENGDDEAHGGANDETRDADEADEADEETHDADEADEEVDRKRRQAEKLALIDKAEPLVEDLLEGKDLGKQPLTATNLMAEEMYAADLVDVLGREKFDYVKVWVNHSGRSSVFSNEE